MILIDTSVWVEFFRGKNKKLGSEVRNLLDLDRAILAVPVLMELLSGCSEDTLPGLRRRLSALPLYYPNVGTWRRIDLWIEQGIAAGQRFGFGDLLIASIAVDRGCRLWSLDSDFERMETLGWLQIYHAGDAP